MNPAHIIRECLTNRDWGWVFSRRDRGQFYRSRRYTLRRGFGLSLIWQQDTSVEAFIARILDHIDATLLIDRRTGLWELKLIRADYDPQMIRYLTRPTSSDWGRLGRRAAADLINSVTVRFTDAWTDDPGAVSVTDTARVQTMGEVIATTLEYPGIRYQSLAVRVAERDLRALSAPLLSGEIVVNRTGADLAPGDVIRLRSGPTSACRCGYAHLRDRPGRRARQRHPAQDRRGRLCSGLHRHGSEGRCPQARVSQFHTSADATDG